MRILVVSALPYNISSSTRAFKTYFNSIDKNDIAQIYTNPTYPDFNYCQNFYQITDKRVIKSWFSNKTDPGIIYQPLTKDNNEVEAANSLKTTASLLKKDIGFFHLCRSVVWNEKRWFTHQLKQWILSFNPDVLFYHNSNSLFISKIALKIRDYFDLPMVVEISDDYYFCKKPTPLLFASIYNKIYKRSFEKMVSDSDGCIFISDKMKEKYSSFNVSNAEVIHIASEMVLDNSASNHNPFSFCYFGNTGFNRDISLIALGKQLQSINKSFTIDVFSPLNGNQGFKGKKNYPGLNLRGFLNYSRLIKTISQYEYIVLAEPLDNRTAEYIGLSLSTKVGDCLSFGKKIICIGNKMSGTIEYILKNKCALVLCSINDLSSLSLQTLTSFKWDEAIRNCQKLFCRDFSMKSNQNKAILLMERAMQKHGETNK